MEQELLTLAEQLGSSPVILLRFVLLDLWFCVWCFVDRCLSFCPFSFGHCVVCPSSFGHCVVCPFSFGHCVVCPFSFGHCVVCPSIYTIFITPLKSSNNRFMVFISPYSISHFVHGYWTRIFVCLCHNRITIRRFLFSIICCACIVAFF